MAVAAKSLSIVLGTPTTGMPLSSTRVKIGRPYCCATAYTEVGVEKWKPPSPTTLITRRVFPTVTRTATGTNGEAWPVVARALDARGVMVSAFFYPVVPHGGARIRTQMSAALTQDDLDFALEAFASAAKEVRAIR